MENVVDARRGCHNTGFSPEAKMLVAMSLAVAISLTRNAIVSLAICAYALAVLAIFGPDWKKAATIAVISFPFIAMALLVSLLSRDTTYFILTSTRIMGGALAVSTLAATTTTSDVLSALSRIKMPKILTSAIFFTAGAIPVLLRETERMRTARRARGFSGGKHLFDRWGMSVLSKTAAMILIRGLKRAERRGEALIARGFRGLIPTKRRGWSGADICAATCAIFFSALVLYLQHFPPAGVPGING